MKYPKKVKVKTKTLNGLDACHLYAILDTAYLGKRNIASVVSQMIEGGVDIIQVRAKGMPLGELTLLAKTALEIAHSGSVPLIVNDHPVIVAEIGADGVHVGQDDMSLLEVRNIVGNNCLIGKSTHSLAQAIAAQAEGADYIGVGPIFATPTKPDYAPVGLELVHQVIPHLRIPFFCIGGIKLENTEQILASGAQRIVVVSGILKAPNILDYCKKLKRLLNCQRNGKWRSEKYLRIV